MKIEDVKVGQTIYFGPYPVVVQKIDLSHEPPILVKGDERVMRPALQWWNPDNCTTVTDWSD